jgi:hypothetical protein
VPDAGISHAVNGARVIAPVLRVQHIDGTSRGFNICAFSIADCEFHQSPLPYP